MSRSLRERLIHELTSVRKELIETLEPIPDSELDYAPKEGMKSYRALIKEIGAMEAEGAVFLTERRVPTWEEAESHVTGNTTKELLESLARIRARTLEFLKGKSDDDLQKTYPIPDGWAEYFGAKELEAEEIVRWIVRHEYYHHGQIVSYRWIQGFNPYDTLAAHEP